MRLWQKTLATVVLIPILVVAGYITYLWATYIDESVASGSAYGFTIGASKQETLDAISRLTNHPHAVVDVTYGLRAGDHFTIAPVPVQIGQLQMHDRWDVYLDGDGKFFNSVRLTFRDGHLAEIYRHRQYFELP